MAKHLRFSSEDRRKRPYWRDERLMGKAFVEHQQEGVLVIGRDVWTRQDMVELLKCGNFVAAQNLTKIANKLQVEDLKQLLARFTMEDLFAQTGFGIRTMYVLMCLIEGAHRDPVKWIDRKEDEIVTLTTEKHRVMKAIGESRRKRRREAQRQSA